MALSSKISVYSNALHGFFLMGGDLAAAKKCIEEVATTLGNAFDGTSKAIP
jgi:hypothetical protein